MTRHAAAASRETPTMLYIAHKMYTTCMCSDQRSCKRSYARIVLRACVLFVKKTNMHLQIRCTQGQNTSVHAIVAHAINESAKFGLHVCFVIAQNDFENNSEKPKQSKPNLRISLHSAPLVVRSCSSTLHVLLTGPYPECVQGMRLLKFLMRSQKVELTTPAPTADRTHPPYAMHQVAPWLHVGRTYKLTARRAIRLPGPPRCHAVLASIICSEQGCHVGAYRHSLLPGYVPKKVDRPGC